MDFVPERSVLDVDEIEIDADTLDMLRSIDFPDVGGVAVSNSFNDGGRDEEKPDMGRRDDRPRRT